MMKQKLNQGLNQKLCDEKIAAAGKLAVCTVYDKDEAVGLAKKLVERGVFAMEIAYRNPEKLEQTDEAIRAVRKEVPEMLVGAATVTSLSLARRAVKSGAQFALSPGFDREVVRWCKKHSFPFYPGVLTPSEVLAAKQEGLTLLKFFPAESFDGVKILGSYRGPFPDVKFIVSGGLNAQNQGAYSALKNVVCVSGSWLSE